jgi:anhydro-N-acetylmuramic acid kinase
MHSQILQLANIAAKPNRLIIGLMSGTSFDGLDIALCRCKGSGTNTVVELLHFMTAPYDAAFKQELKSIFSKKDADLEKVCVMNAHIGKKHAALVLAALQEWHVNKLEVDLIASHGQTIYHAPKHLHPTDGFPNATLQIGDGDHIAVDTGIITISDFRQKHVAAGGEGAPLAVYGDYLLFSQYGENRIMLNIGGIANFTYLPGNLDGSLVFSTDVGPGNTIMDAYVQQHYPGQFYDAYASMAKQGTINDSLLAALLDHPFFQVDFPKTIGPELFNMNYLQKALLKTGLAEISHENVLATLNAFSAKAIVDALKETMKENDNFTIYVSGGGMYNPLLLENIQHYFPSVQFKNTNELGIHPDAKEAVLFAILANECVSGGAVHLGAGRQGIPSVTMGKISLPA